MAHRQSQNSDRNLMSTSTNIVNPFNDQFICGPDQLLERSVPQHYTATYRSQYYRTMTWTDFGHPIWILPLEGCRVSWLDADRSVLPFIKITKTLFCVGLTDHTLHWDREPYSYPQSRTYNDVQSMKAISLFCTIRNKRTINWQMRTLKGVW